MSEDLEQIIFPLEVDDEGWPPFGAERMWAQKVADGAYRIDNSPFFAEGIALDDIVTALTVREGELPQYGKTISHSGRISLSIIVLEASSEHEITAILEESDCWFEQGQPAKMVIYAVSVPSLSKYAPIKKFLSELEKSEKLSFTELCMPA